MFLWRHVTQPAVRAGFFSHISGASGPGSYQPLQMLHSLSGVAEEMIGKTRMCDNSGRSLFGILGLNSAFMKVNENITLPCAMSIRSYIHSGEPKEFEAGRDPRNTDFVSGFVDRSGRSFMEGFQNTSGEAKAFEPGRNFRNAGFGSGVLDRSGGRSFMEGFQFSRYNVEQNADVIHIKMLRNNTFVSVTDSKGNKKFGISSGKLTDKGGKVSRYAAEACAEQAGRNARDRGIKSLVVKVNGFTYFKKKKQAILAIKEGYSHSRGDKHPIVYVEDTTRRPHNGCRLRKKRRV